MLQMKTITRVLCPIKGSTTDDVCKDINKVVPELERTYRTIDTESIQIRPDGDVFVLTVCVPVDCSTTYTLPTPYLHPTYTLPTPYLHPTYTLPTRRG